MEDNENEGKETDLVHPDVKKKIEDVLDSKGVTDYTLEIAAGSQKGDNYLGVIAKVTVEGKNEEGVPIKFDWIVKSSPQDDVYRSMLKVDEIYAREILIYEKILPQFTRFQAERGAASSVFVTAECVLTCLEKYRECFVMQDMKVLGYEMRDRRTPLDLKHVRLVMKAYGKLHAVSYALNSQNPEEFDRIRRDTKEEIFRQTDKNIITKALNFRHEKVIATLDPLKDAKAIEAYKKFAERTVDIVLESMTLAETDSSSVVGHGDCWSNNMLFKYEIADNITYPTKVRLLDWQLARYGSPVFDLSYFLFTSTDKKFRDKYYDEIIRVYYYTLCAHVAELGSDPELLLPFETLLAQLKRYSVFGLYMSTMVLQVVMGEADEAPDWSGSTAEEVMDSLNFVSRNHDVWSERIRGIVVDFYQKGYLDFLR